MFREMRRFNQEIPREESIEVLKSRNSGVLAVCGDNGYPYTVPMSYVYHDNKLFFHGATVGHKLDSIRRDDRVSFCVIDRDEVIPEKFATKYRSVVVFGRARIVEDNKEKRQVLEQINTKYAPGLEMKGSLEIKKDWDRVVVISVDIEHITGKVDLYTMIETARARREINGEPCQEPKK